MPNPKQPLVMLVAEDDLDDQFFLTQAITHAMVNIQPYFVIDGIEVVEYLQQSLKYKEEDACPKPGLVLMDIQMPRMNGFETLASIRKHPELNNLPVVMFSTSNADLDVDNSQNLGADGYEVKPSDFQEYIELIRRLYERWS